MEGERVDTRLLPRLVKDNWNSAFKENFREYALTCEEAGEIIITGVDLNLRRPVKDMGRKVQDRNGQLVEDVNDPEFEDNERVDKLFERYGKRYKKY
jgi:hypothetical protein